MKLEKLVLGILSSPVDFLPSISFNSRKTTEFSTSLKEKGSKLSFAF